VTHPLQKSLTSTDFRLTNAVVFTGLRFEVEQASRGLSAIAELLVILPYGGMVGILSLLFLYSYGFLSGRKDSGVKLRILAYSTTIRDELLPFW